MSSVITILKIKVSLHSHWELQSSNPEKGPKSKENDPPPPDYQKAGYGCDLFPVFIKFCGNKCAVK